MNTIFTVFKKELMESLRDKRTLFTAIILPALLIPIITLIITKVQKSIADKEGNKKLKIVLIGSTPALENSIADSTFNFVKSLNLEEAKLAVGKDSLDAIIDFAPNFSSSLDSQKNANVNLYFKSTNFLFNKKINEKLDMLNEKALEKRLAALNINRATLKPINIIENDVASVKEQIGKTLGGFLPYMFIIFSFLGCLYPSIDLFTGEKEKGTMETLLTTSASRFHILIGKTLAISFLGLASGIMTILGMVVGLRLFSGIPAELLTTITSLISTKFVVMLFAMLIPLTIFIAGMLSALVVRAKSFKEAQSLATPVNFIIIIPAVIATLPGITLNWQTALVPVLNIALATKEIIAGTIHMGQYVLIVLSLIALALAAVWYSYKQFSNEKMVLKH
jgi:sodium transport system permease protein